MLSLVLSGSHRVISFPPAMSFPPPSCPRWLLYSLASQSPHIFHSKRFRKSPPHSGAHAILWCCERPFHSLVRRSSNELYSCPIPASFRFRFATTASSLAVHYDILLKPLKNNILVDMAPRGGLILKPTAGAVDREGSRGFGCRRRPCYYFSVWLPRVIRTDQPPSRRGDAARRGSRPWTPRQMLFLRRRWRGAPGVTNPVDDGRWADWGLLTAPAVPAVQPSIRDGHRCAFRRVISPSSQAFDLQGLHQRRLDRPSTRPTRPQPPDADFHFTR